MIACNMQNGQGRVRGSELRRDSFDQLATNKTIGTHCLNFPALTGAGTLDNFISNDVIKI